MSSWRYVCQLQCSCLSLVIWPQLALSNYELPLLILDLSAFSKHWFGSYLVKGPDTSILNGLGY